MEKYDLNLAGRMVSMAAVRLQGYALKTTDIAHSAVVFEHLVQK